MGKGREDVGEKGLLEVGEWWRRGCGTFWAGEQATVGE